MEMMPGWDRFLGCMRQQSIQDRAGRIGQAHMSHTAITEE